MSSKDFKTYTAKERNMYLVGMFGQNVTYSIISAALAYYLQFTLLIPAIAVSTIMSISRVWDAFNDPMMGTIVDKTRSKWGKCRPYLIFSPIPIMIITILCFINGFYNPDLGMFEGRNALIVIAAGTTYILWGMAYTVGDIPLWGVTALMSEKEKDRAKLISAARIVAAIAGGIATLGLQPLALALGEIITEKYKVAPNVGEKYGFITVVTILAVIGAVTFQMTGIFIRERIPGSKKSYSLRENFGLMWKNLPFRKILISGVLSSTRLLLNISAIPLVTYYYASKDPLMAIVYIVMLGGGMFSGMFLGMGLVPKLTKKFEKKDVYNYANLMCVIPYLMIFVLYLIAPQDLVKPLYLVLMFIIFLFCGFGSGATDVLRSLMIADAVDYEDYYNRIRPDGVFFAGQTFIVKLSTGIATIISGLAYSAVGFSDEKIQVVNDYIAAGGIPRLNPEFSSYMMILFFIVSIPPAIGCLLGVFPTWKYPFTDKEHEKMLEVLNKRRHEEGTEVTE